MKTFKLDNWLPTTKKEVEARGWDYLDVILFSGDAYVDRDACLRGDAIACGSAYVSKGSVMSGHSHAEDNAYLRGASAFPGFSSVYPPVPWIQ